MRRPGLSFVFDMTMEVESIRKIRSVGLYARPRWVRPKTQFEPGYPAWKAEVIYSKHVYFFRGLDERSEETHKFLSSFYECKRLFVAVRPPTHIITRVLIGFIKVTHTEYL